AESASESADVASGSGCAGASGGALGGRGPSGSAAGPDGAGGWDCGSSVIGAARGPGAPASANLPQPLDQLQLRGGAGELGERLGLRDLVYLVPQRLLGALLGGQRGLLIEVLGPDGRIGEHCDLVGLDLQSTAADEKMLLGPIRRLHPHFAGLEQREQRRMPWSNAEVAHRARSEQHRRRAGEDLA